MRKRQEHCRGEDLPRLHALQGKAGEEPAPAERRVLENHRAGTGDLAGDCEALDEPENDEKERGNPTDLLVRGQDTNGHRREPHEEHAHEQHGLAAMGVSPVAEKEGANRPRDIADAVGGQ